MASPAPGAAGRTAPARQARLQPSQPGRGQRGLPPGGPYTGANPTDRGKLGSKRHLITDRHGVPLAFCVTGANRHDSVVFEELVDALPPIAGKPGRPRRWPDKLHADKAYDMDRCRDHLKQRGSPHVLPARAWSVTIGWAGIAGWLSARMPGLPAWENCGPASNVGSTSTWRCCPWHVASSARGDFLSFVRRS